MYHGASKCNCYALCRNSSSFILNMFPADTIGQLFHHVLLDEECALYACRLKGRFTPQPSEPRPLNPIAQVLLYGDDMVGTQSERDKAPSDQTQIHRGVYLHTFSVTLWYGPGPLLSRKISEFMNGADYFGAAFISTSTSTERPHQARDQREFMNEAAPSSGLNSLHGQRWRHNFRAAPPPGRAGRSHSTLWAEAVLRIVCCDRADLLKTFARIVLP